jgi:hypothetical protein
MCSNPLIEKLIEGDQKESSVSGVVSLNLTTLTLLVSETETLTAMVHNNTARKAVTWTSCTPSVATVSGNGIVTALAAGNATITVATVDGNHWATCTVTVRHSTGEADAPFLIHNELELRQVGTGTDGWILSAHYRLAADITLGGEWTAIGSSYTIRFSGSFDGNNKTITGLRINKPDESYQGMFGWIDTGGVVKNLTLFDCDIYGKWSIGGVVGISYGTVENCHVAGMVSGSISVGGVAGRNYGTVGNCYTTGDVNVTGDYGGGVVGFNYDTGTVINCYATGDVSGNEDVGGVAGRNDGTITNSYATGNVSGDKRTLGGVVGTITDTGTVINCYATGDVSGNEMVGGVVGWLSNYSIVENCYATGNVEGNDYVGGVAGRSLGTITNCNASGVVSGIRYIGGVAGYVNSTGTVKNCYATDTVSGNSYVGGVAGYNQGKVYNCNSTGDVSGNECVGGVAGINYSTGTVENCYNTAVVSGAYNVGGVVGQNSGTVENCVALNPNMKCRGTPYQRIGGGSGAMTNNYARTDMKVNNGAVKWTNDISGKDGADITVADYSMESWWSGSAGFDFSATWEWHNASGLPVLYSGGSKK